MKKKTSLKLAIILMMTLAVGLGNMIFCPADCLASSKECHKEVQEQMPSCHQDPTSRAQEESEKCACPKGVGLGILKENKGLSTQSFQSVHHQTPIKMLTQNRINIQKVNLLKVRTQITGPPGFVQASLYSYLVHTLHSPPCA